jgi:hypothetical protein
MRKTLLTLLSALLLTPAARAQLTCPDTDTIDDCFQKAWSQVTGDKLPPAAAVVTGPNAPGTSIGSANQDFLSHLFAALQSAQLDQKNRQLNIAYNMPVGGLGTLQLQTVFYQPEIFQTLADQLTAAGQAQELTTLEQSLNDSDDVAVNLSFTPATSGLGRNYKNYRNEFQPYFRDAVSADGDSLIKAETKLDSLVQELTATVIREHPNRSPSDPIHMGDLGPRRGEAILAIMTAASDEAKTTDVTSKAIVNHNLASFADLVSNQPQLSFTLSRRWKDRTVGPNEVTGEVSYEIGFVNLNSLNRSCQRQQKGCTLDDFKKYAANHAHGLKTADRLKLTFDYDRMQDYALSLPADNIDLRLPRSEKLTYMLTYGRQVWFDKQQNSIGRIDVTGSFVSYYHDPLLQDRGTLDLSYTQKVSDTFSFPLGITYANHGEFLGQSDRRLSAHFGLHAKIFDQ